MEIKPFHMPEIEPGTLIRIRSENGGGYLLSCPACNCLRFVGVTLFYWTNFDFVDSVQELTCPSCGVLFSIVQNKFRFDVYHDEHEAKRMSKPQLKTYGTPPPTQRALPIPTKERVTA